MKLVSVNLGLPREVAWHNINVTTGIFKEPVKGRVALRKLNLDGDGQADLTVHGGEFKAVYCYPLVHYDFWKAQLPGKDLPLAILTAFVDAQRSNALSTRTSVPTAPRHANGPYEPLCCDNFA